MSCLGATHIPERVDEDGKPYKCTADDSAYATFELEERRHLRISTRRGASACVATTCSPCRWMARTAPPSPACATAGLNTTATRPRPVWNPDIDQPIKFFDGWSKVPDAGKLRQRLQGAVGTFPAARRARRAVPLDAAGRRQGRSARRGRHPELGAAQVARRAQALEALARAVVDVSVVVPRWRDERGRSSLLRALTSAATTVLKKILRRPDRSRRS